MPERELTVYEREGCHLCDAMLAALAPLAGPLGFRVRRVDVDDDAVLRFRYGRRIPVLAEGGAEICHHFLDEAALRRHLGAPDAAPEGG